LDNVRFFVTEKAVQGYFDIIAEIKTVLLRLTFLLGDGPTAGAQEDV